MLRNKRKSVCLLLIILLVENGTGQSCETPNDWLSGGIQIQQAARDQLDNVVYTPYNISEQTWLNGVVKYKLHSSLTLEDTTEVLKAFEEYHKKTCIQFKPWRYGDNDFVSVEVDESVCGFANVCKIGGPQVAKFGKNCRNMQTMVHQLGHTLCLGHEHQRTDRDNFVNFSSCSSNPPKVESRRRPMGIYDYASQMHPKCGSCNGSLATGERVEICGPDASPGLSVLDVDTLNYLYNCQGCQRHRWIPAASLSSMDFPKMLTFGYETEDKQPIYACRAYYQGEVASGVYKHAQKTCEISWYHKPYQVQEQVEVLTISGGVVGEDCSVYKLVNKRAALDEGNSLIYVGNILRKEYWNWTSHITYSSLNDKKAVGKTWLRNGKEFNQEAEMSTGTSIVRPNEYQVLTCKLDTTCMMKKLFADRKIIYIQNYPSP